MQTGYQEAAQQQAEKAIQQAQIIREALLSRAMPVKELLENLAGQAQADSSGTVFAFAAYDGQPRVDRQNNIEYCAGFIRNRQPDFLQPRDPHISICFNSSGTARIEWARGPQDRSSEGYRSWNRSQTFRDDTKAIDIFTTELQDLWANQCTFIPGGPKMK